PGWHGRDHGRAGARTAPQVAGRYELLVEAELVAGAVAREWRRIDDQEGRSGPTGRAAPNWIDPIPVRFIGRSRAIRDPGQFTVGDTADHAAPCRGPDVQRRPIVRLDTHPIPGCNPGRSAGFQHPFIERLLHELPDRGNLVPKHVAR